jgi:DNA-binding NarL/FixJ family response regulator
MRRPRAQVRIRAQDPVVRARILERLEGLRDVSVQIDDSGGADGVPSADAGPEEAGPALTPRELEVLPLMSDGLANKEIASRLGFSTHTAKFHVESILRKLGAANRAEAVREGIRRGLIGL